MDFGKLFREFVVIVVFIVLDKNDNSFRFINKDFSFFVLENFFGYGEIGVISVIDVDVGRNGWVVFSVVN